MSPLCRAFRLALITQILWPVAISADLLMSDSMLMKSRVQDVLEPPPIDLGSCQDAIPTGPIDMTSCDYESVASVSHDLYTELHDLVSTPFFKYFQVDLFRECPFWDDDGSCSDPGCAITTLDESEVPEKWRAATLSKLEPIAEDRHQMPGCYYRDSDFCFLDDHTDGDYYDLSTIPERYTGYSGPDARRVWSAIYNENCFDMSEQTLVNKISKSSPDTLITRELVEQAEDDTCLEKKVYYKIISGLHASISTHICQEYLNHTTGQWEPNLQCFVDRVASHPERLQYLYFNNVLLLRAVARLAPYLTGYDYCSTGNHEDDVATQATLQKVIGIAQEVGRFDETVLFQGENAPILREEFKTHFRNVTRIIDCTGCDKCRLWGKVQTTGVATALKILFELDDAALDPKLNSNLLQRSEIVALINTLHRFSESLYAVSVFRDMWSGAQASATESILAEALNPPTPGVSPKAGDESPETLFAFEDLLTKSASVIQACRDSTLECVNDVVDIVRRTLATVFSSVPKEPGSNYAEL